MLGQEPTLTDSSEALPTGTVTLLFSDVEASTRLLSRLGDDYTHVVSGQRAIQRAAWARWHGRELGTEGDSFLVVFSTATDAANAALEAQQALATHEWPNGEQVRVRIGMHTGEPVVHEDGTSGWTSTGRLGSLRLWVTHADAAMSERAIVKARRMLLKERWDDEYASGRDDVPAEAIAQAQRVLFPELAGHPAEVSDDVQVR